ncbi:acyltransferase family protein [Ancylobacter radicis]|uniref:Acyltransferase n=1 Tax=Ancylobacter radicis TaxID=2836179 RepID=A0ABS5R4H7_9HYPH|nr:acyltransferase [Ancylobacter radicis]MBS9476105.1 acyltransferase [Ancylobacter radicis]
MFNSVQYLRAIAALAVVLYHEATVMNTKTNVGIFLLGEYGVDLFFVISGFIMVVTTQRREAEPLKFFGKRLKRVVPMYWIATFCVVLGLLILPNAFKSTVLDIPTLVMSLLFIPHYHPVVSHQIWPVLIQGWTLNYEMIFYCIFALSLVISHRYRVLSVSLIILTLVTLGHLVHPTSAIGRTVTGSLSLEFIWGALIGYVMTEKRAYLGHLLLGLLAVNAVCQGVSIAMGEFNRAINVGLLAALAMATLLWVEERHKIFTNRVMLYLADASYSIYLFHAFGLGAVRFAAAKLGLDVSQPLWDGVTLVLGFAAGVLPGAVIHYVIERPIMKFRFSSILPKRRAPPLRPDQPPVS